MKTIIENVKIAAISAWLPTNILEMSSLVSEYGKSEVENIIKTTGIERVRIADEKETSSDLCFKAAENLIEREGINRKDIDGLVFVSQTMDYILPATSISLQKRLGLGKGTVCIDVHYGCSGYIYGLLQAAMWLHCGACENVLVLAGDTTSRMIHPKDKSLRMVFGDCGTASWLTIGTSPMGFHICSDGGGADRLIVPAGGFRMPSSRETSRIVYDEDHNGRTLDNLYMDGLSIFNFAITNVYKDIDILLKTMRWEKEDIGLFALHQANNFMVNYIRKKMKVRQEYVPTNVRNYGNTGPATIPLLLADVCPVSSYNLNKVILSGFGVGLSWGSVGCNLDETHFYEPVNR